MNYDLVIVNSMFRIMNLNFICATLRSRVKTSSLKVVLFNYRFLVLIFVRGRVDNRTLVRLEGLGKLKNLVTLSFI
jgi:hypothetical protein